MKKNRIAICSFLTGCAILLASLFYPGTLISKAASSDSTSYAARPSVNGALHVEGVDLVDENNDPAALHGLSTHGLTWYPDFINESVFNQLSRDWNTNLIRLAMYSDVYCNSEKEMLLSRELVKKGVDYAISSDMYVIVDWHILEDNNPLIHKDEAAEFFDMISKEYANVPNVIYEICNEPNGSATWADIKEYANEIIPIIRSNSPDSLILVGTPNYDRNLMVATMDPLPFDNLMYSLHFYAGSHYDDLYAELRVARSRDLPVFITECGLSEESGDGVVDYENASKWFSYLNAHNISYAIWSLSNKPESSAMINGNYEIGTKIRNTDITETGQWVRALLRGYNPGGIGVTEYGSEFSDFWHRLFLSAEEKGLLAVRNWGKIAGAMAGITILFLLVSRLFNRKTKSYDSLPDIDGKAKKSPMDSGRIINLIIIALSAIFTLIYLVWRIMYSIPTEYGWLPVCANLILLFVEILGFFETLIHHDNMLELKDRPLPKIADEEFPEVDIFIATYNEPEDLLRRTINGCNHLKYPDTSKVHVWICDDNRRASMRALAEEMKVGYFDRPDNKGAKAGNLNNALSKTHAPYVVTLDADMIPKSDFLLKTIPYFIDAKKRNELLPEKDRTPLGLLQTPQCFYDPDVFQHALYSERTAPNEQDFFYRTIEVAKTSTNSVIYGGSNTILAREALEAVGGFYTESITEDFATGMLIESAGFVSLALPDPLASGRTPHTFKEHIQQRTRWGRGVIVTAKKLKLLTRPGLTLRQKLSYWSSVVYWYSPIKNLIYLISPLLFAVFGIPVFRCSWLELVVYWLPMFIMSDIALRVVSKNAVSEKWSGIYETCVMPKLFFPILQEMFGITLSAFKVTDKSGAGTKRVVDKRDMAPFIVFTILSVIGIIRVITLIDGIQSVGLVILIFWMIRNTYFLIMAMFLVDGRDSDGECVHVWDGEMAAIQKKGENTRFDGITTHLTEHSVSVYLDDDAALSIGNLVELSIETVDYEVNVSGVVTGTRQSRNRNLSVWNVEITDFKDSYYEYLQILYDRTPTLPQNLNRDFGIIPHLWSNIANRLAHN